MSCGRMSLTVPIQTPTPTDSRQTARYVHVGILAGRLPLTHWRSAFCRATDNHNAIIAIMYVMSDR